MSTVDATSTVAEILSTTTVSIDATSTQTFSADVSSTEATFQATSEATTETSADITALTTVTAETTADTTTWVTLTTEATTDSTTWFTETSTVGATTTSEAPPSITTFSLRAADSTYTSVNGQWVLLSPSNSISVGPAPNLGSESRIGYFSIEPVTNYLKIDDFYVAAANSAYLPLFLSRADPQLRYIVCTPPAALGEKLWCAAISSDGDRWSVNVGTSLHIVPATVIPFYSFLNLIVS
ncbi:unnamed protein product [Fusarium equiseti]|uniref:Uncharacterized protein n=1 Tax=Fusarium equiseti TaxID=61235 RepID=A0A8J2N9T0_FUSEQ|nr:unnamed protein product [Fusarium equiseti]